MARLRFERMPPTEDTTTEVTVTVDELTDKQREALRVATVQGFFDRPQQATATEVAARLGVARSTFLYHLRRAEQRVFDQVFPPSTRRRDGEQSDS